MYSPEAFRIHDRATLAAFMRRHSFATLVTHDGSMPQATHLPVILEDDPGPNGTLVMHMARSNPQWRHFEDGREALVIFTGPHAYVSPAWYATAPAVPTWNYTVVHAYGTPRLVSDPVRFSRMLDELVDFHESTRDQPWPGILPEEFRDGLMKAIVGIEIPISRIEGKFKLSQNRPGDAARVIERLAVSQDQTDRELAEMMHRELQAPEHPPAQP